MRLARYSHCDENAFVLVVIYLDRAQGRQPGLVLNSHTVHRLLIACLVLAIKFSSDFYYKNSHYAQVGGVPLEEFNRLELELIRCLGWDLWVDPEELACFRERLSG